MRKKNMDTIERKIEMTREKLANLEEEYKEQALSPIICAGDVLGAVIITTKDGKIHFTDTEKALAAAAADFLGRQMES